MKKLFLLFIAGSLLSTSFAQSDMHVKGKALGASFFLNDFKSASELRNLGIVQAFNSKDFFKLSRMNPGVAVNYLQGLSNHMDFAATLGGSSVDYPNDNITSTGKTLLLEATAQVNFKLLSDQYVIVPFVDLGMGVSKFQKNYAAFVPAGLGLQLNISDQVFFLLNSQYRIPVTERASYHFYHSIGIVQTFSKKIVPLKVVEIPAAVVLDRDGDGIVDSLDRCPDIAGLTALQGCPDRDGDGIADIDDKCPDVKGVAKYQGCPIPDTDGDGVNDEVDKCPNVPGLARYQGCPIPDTDGDGVNDEVDKCPTEAGPGSNYGCPVIDVTVIEKINKAAKNVFFETGSAKLLAKSNKSLQEIAAIMKANPSYKIAVDGYTDNTGGTELNQKLSESRANSVKQNLIDNGVNEGKVTATGYGEAKPVVENNTAANRAKNRRVEMTMTNY